MYPFCAEKMPAGEDFGNACQYCTIWVHLGGDMQREPEKNVVKIHNDINRVTFSGFDKREISVFYSLAKILDDKGGDEIHIPFSELKEIMGTRTSSRKAFVDLIKETVRKILSMQASIQTDGKRTIFFVPFITFDINEETDMMRVRVNPDSVYLFNALTKNFTYFELTAFNQLKTKYSQRLFSIFKQYRSTGKVYISAEDFVRILDVPASYDSRKISQKILNPSITELSAYFKRLTVKKISEQRRITGYEFHFYPEKKTITIEQNAGNTEVLKKEKLFCPHCGKEMVLRKNKETGTAFYGHKYYKNNPCQATYTSLEQLEEDRQKIQQEKERIQQSRNTEKKAWDSVLKKQQSLFDTLKKK